VATPFDPVRRVSIDAAGGLGPIVPAGVLTMKKAPLYSRSRTTASPGIDSGTAVSTGAANSAPRKPLTGALPATAATGTEIGPATDLRRSTGRRWLLRNERRVWAALVLLLIATALAVGTGRGRLPKAMTIEQIDASIRKSIEDKPLASPYTRAYEAVLPSVVRVVGLMTEGDDGSAAKADGPVERGVGTGVVIVDNGTILTNLHVVNGARRVKVTFMDGSESEAVVLSKQPENDLAVLRAKTIPDDLEAATMRSTADLAPGDAVLAVGFPFGIGPSASGGIVSGLKREFRSPEGQQRLTNLIQFDAAANPGNSGGPLVTMEGEVVGIVTAILNPSHQRTFIGIGFAVPIENAAAAAGMPPF
jgi:S1-C subfamily serine protease